MNIIELHELRPIPDTPAPYPLTAGNPIPLVIDNGSYQCRAGWASSAAPILEFRNIIAKPRRDRTKQKDGAAAGGGTSTSVADGGDGESMPPIQVGNDIVNIEAMRFQLKTQFDRNVVTHLHNSEQIFDYVLRNLSVTGASDGGVPHPVVMTEALATPNYSRQLMSELLFECYAVPRVAFGIDALFSFEHSRPHRDAGLIISFGYHTTHVVPVLEGRACVARARRLNLGGAQMIAYLHRLLQLKYPVHTAAITQSRVESILHAHCSVAVDFAAALRNWSGLEFYEAHVKKVQLPFALPSARGDSAMTAEQRVERRREMARRLADMNARRRDEKLVEDELVLQKLVAIRELWVDGDKEEFEYAIGLMEIGSVADLEKQIQSTHARIHRTKAKIAAAIDGANGSSSLDDATAQARLAAAAIPQPPGDLTIVEWVRQTRQRRADILERRATRRQRRQDLARRRTAAAQERMRVISQLARKEKGNDDFGARDEDWDVYKTIRRNTGDSDSDAEQERLLECEEVLRHHDADFEKTGGSASASSAGVGGAALSASALGSENPAELYQLHVGVEAIRCTEIIFQPSLVGCSEAGLAEIIEYVLRQFSGDEQQAMVANILMTGGCANFRGLAERLERELREMRPFESIFELGRAADAGRDAWLGACQVAAAGDDDMYTTRQDYEEMGGEYLREHRWGNRFFATPASIVESATEITM